MTTIKQKQDVCLALGANIGDRLAAFVAAREALRPYVEIEACSKLYETEPLYAMDQPAFLNAVVRGTTALEPQALLFTVKEIERTIGRLPTFRYGPRVIDVDIVSYGATVFHSPELTIPHALMAERLFVLQPFCDVASEWVHPVLHQTAAELLAVCDVSCSVRLVQESW